MFVSCEGADCSADLGGSSRVKVQHVLKDTAGSETASSTLLGGTPGNTFLSANPLTYKLKLSTINIAA